MKLRFYFDRIHWYEIYLMVLGIPLCLAESIFCVQNRIIWAAVILGCFCLGIAGIPLFYMFFPSIVFDSPKNTLFISAPYVGRKEFQLDKVDRMVIVFQKSSFWNWYKSLVIVYLKDGKISSFDFFDKRKGVTIGKVSPRKKAKIEKLAAKSGMIFCNTVE